MRGNSGWGAVFGVEKAVIEDVEYDEDRGEIEVRVRPVARQRGRCGQCRRRCPGYDQGRGVERRWRALDVGTVPAYLVAAVPRVHCPEHRVVAAHVPWARHDAGHTHAFDQQVAWLATQTSKTAVTKLMRVTWRTGRVDLAPHLGRRLVGQRLRACLVWKQVTASDEPGVIAQER